ncbi:MAG: hypothetical protein Q9192_005838 [Flavoplaca navasiana]
MYLRLVLILLMVLTSTTQYKTLGDMYPAFSPVASDTVGSCTEGQTAEIRAGFRDAIKAIQKALEAIDNLKKPAPKALLNINKDRRKTWKRQAQLLKALFNINVDKDHPLGNNNADANHVQCEIIDEYDYDTNPAVEWRYWQLCGDNWIHWKNPTELDPSDPQVPQRRLVGDIQPDGAFFVHLRIRTLDIMRYRSLEHAPRTGNPICWGENHAATVRSLNLVTFCPGAFNLDSLDVTKGSISPGDAIGDKLTLAHLWIHELCHLIHNFLDQDAVNTDGTVIPNQHANGWLRGTILARLATDRARQAPDLYALFATAVFFDNYGWGNGVAEV